MVLLTGLSTLYDSLTTSLKALICHVAMKCERSSSWRGEGERVRGRCMRCEVVLHTYRHFRWDADAIRKGAHAFASDSTTTSLFKMPPFLRTSTCPSSTDYSQSGQSPDPFTLTFPTNSHSNFFFARLSQLVHLIFRLYSVFAVWNSAASTIDVRR